MHTAKKRKSISLISHHPVLPCDDPEDFPRLHARLRSYFEPSNPLQSILVQQLTSALLRHGRSEALAAGHFTQAIDRADPQADPYQVMACSLDDRFDRLQRYQFAARSDVRFLLRALGCFPLTRSTEKEKSENGFVSYSAGSVA